MLLVFVSYYFIILKFYYYNYNYIKTFHMLTRVYDANIYDDKIGDRLCTYHHMALVLTTSICLKTIASHRIACTVASWLPPIAIGITSQFFFSTF